MDGWRTARERSKVTLANSPTVVATKNQRSDRPNDISQSRFSAGSLSVSFPLVGFPLVKL